jgi:hypothetical protein
MSNTYYIHWSAGKQSGVLLQSAAKNMESLFSCRYNPLRLYFHSPVAGFILLVLEVS